MSLELETKIIDWIELFVLAFYFFFFFLFTTSSLPTRFSTQLFHPFLHHMRFWLTIIFALFLGYISANSQSKFNFKSLNTKLNSDCANDSLASLHYHSAIKKLITSALFASGCALLKPTMPHSPPILALLLFTFRSVDLIRYNYYANREMHLLDLQLALSSLSFSAILLYSRHVSIVRSIGIIVFIAVPLSFRLGTLIATQATNTLPE